MKERPILFSAPMVRAILDGTKTQTRRQMKVQPDDNGTVTVGKIGGSRGVAYIGNERSGGIVTRVPCPYGQPGDRLWVRETGWQRPERTPRMLREGADTWAPYYFDADELNDADREELKAWGFKRRPSIFMPRQFSRLTLELTGIRVEQLQEISEADAMAEGVNWQDRAWLSRFTARHVYTAVWERINGKGSWAANPFVWVLEFQNVSP